jgi:signal peptidase I
MITDATVSYPVIVDEETYFVLGDNRTDSVDSRDGSVGLLEENDIVGKVVFCFKNIN